MQYIKNTSAMHIKNTSPLLARNSGHWGNRHWALGL